MRKEKKIAVWYFLENNWWKFISVVWFELEFSSFFHLWRWTTH